MHDSLQCLGVVIEARRVRSQVSVGAGCGRQQRRQLLGDLAPAKFAFNTFNRKEHYFRQTFDIILEAGVDEQLDFGHQLAGFATKPFQLLVVGREGPTTRAEGGQLQQLRVDVHTSCLRAVYGGGVVVRSCFAARSADDNIDKHNQHYRLHGASFRFSLLSKAKPESKLKCLCFGLK